MTAAFSDPEGRTFDQDLRDRRGIARCSEGYFVRIGAGRDLLDSRSVGQRKNDFVRLVRRIGSTDLGLGDAERDCACAISAKTNARAIRNEHVGFVFQNFQLIPTLTALENVTVPMELRGDRSARKLGRGIVAARRTG